MPDYRKALLFCKLETKKEYTHYDKDSLLPEEQNVSSPIEYYLKKIQKYPLLEKEEEILLIEKAQKEDLIAREKIIHANLRLVVRIARRYQRSGVSFSDLIAEGNFGLIHAIKKFNSTMNCRFSTYAAWWSQHYIEYYLMNQIRTVRLPVHISKKMNKVEKIEQAYLQKGQTSCWKSLDQEGQEHGLNLSTSEVDRLKIWSDPITSLDTFLDQDHMASPEDHSEESEYLLGTDFKEVDSKCQEHSMIETLVASLNSLEKDVIYHRTGLGGFKEMTFEEIADHMHMKKDRVRFIYQKAIKKMMVYQKQKQHESSHKKIKQH